MYSIKAQHFDIQKIADSGQAFRFYKIGENTYSIVTKNKYVEVRQDEDILIFSCSREEFESIWEEYFDLKTDYGLLIADLLVENPELLHDKFLLSAIAFSGGITILKQDFFETLISFIISQRKSIPAIKNCIGKLCHKCGELITGTGINGEVVITHKFPTADTLATLNEKELLECGLGYRAEYVKAAAEWYLQKFNILLSERMKYYPNALEELMKIKGIGSKVANCVCLFGLYQMDACPVDVWIQRIIDENYGGKEPFWMRSRYAGLLQQFVFYYKRYNS